MKAITLHLGLDVHKDSIAIAIAEGSPKGEVRSFGTIANDLHALEKSLARIRKAHPAARLEVAYEAGPCGFGIARRLQQLKVPCLVAAPSLIPRQPGAPFKTDQRDARKLARLFRAGERIPGCIAASPVSWPAGSVTPRPRSLWPGNSVALSKGRPRGQRRCG